ncbi:MAG: formyltetrahydrofolate deformylase [Candidatus Carbobacillus altaicus]|nr:formyltetrahydrofolate deformylase [Candidatus Carbobacillus altaicus]
MSLKAKSQTMENRARILLTCPDRPGIVAEITSFLYRLGANIVALDQYTTDPSGGVLFMRVEFDAPDLPNQKKELEAAFAEIDKRFQMQWEIRYAANRKKIAIFASTADHALLELLYQWKAGELAGDIALVISNHEHLRSAVEPFNIPYIYIPVTPETKQDREAQELALLSEYRIDLVVLARYMQILSTEFVRRYPNRIINIHHSFLPAFIGARPYERAYARGVKLIGATAHYVTEELDEGPIIEQDVERVTHRADITTLKKIGRNIERIVLARSVEWHLEDRILVYGNRTIVFT